MDFMFDWEAEGDRFSFEDSDRFEEDSLCSWISEPESLCNNWRGWRKQNGGSQGQMCGGSFAKDHEGKDWESFVHIFVRFGTSAQLLGICILYQTATVFS